MRDRISVMLDSMIAAVDEGLSYDGIVSIPEIGLEDFGRRPGMTGWLDDSVELFRTTRAAISRVVDKLHSKVIPSRRKNRRNDRAIIRNIHATNQNNRISVADSKFSPDDRKPETQPISPVFPSPQEPQISANLPAPQNSAALQQESSTHTLEHITVSREPRRPLSSPGVPTSVLRESKSSVTEASKVSQVSPIDEEGSQKDRRVHTQYSPVATPTTPREAQFSAWQASTSSQASHINKESSQKDEVIHTPRSRDDPGDSEILPRKKTTPQESRSSAPQGTTASQASHIDEESSQKGKMVHTQHSHGDPSDGSPRKNTSLHESQFSAPEDTTASQASHIDEERSPKDEEIRTQHSRSDPSDSEILPRKKTVPQGSQFSAPQDTPASQASHSDEERSQKHEVVHTQHSRGDSGDTASEILPRKKTAPEESQFLTPRLTAASQTSHINKENSQKDESVRIQYSPVATPTVPREIQFSTPYGSTASQPRKRQGSSTLATAPEESKSPAPQSFTISQPHELLESQTLAPQAPTASHASRIAEESSQEDEAGVQPLHSPIGTKRLPRKRHEQALEDPDAGQKSSREEDEQVLENIPQPDVGQISPLPDIEPVHVIQESRPGLQPRKRD